MTNYHHFSIQYLLISIHPNSPLAALRLYDSRAFNPFVCIICCFGWMYLKIHKYVLHPRSGPAGSYLFQKHSTMILLDIPDSVLHLGSCFEMSYRTLSSPSKLNTQEASISLLQWISWCACLYLPVWDFLWVLCPRASLLGCKTPITFPWSHWCLLEWSFLSIHSLSAHEVSLPLHFSYLILTITHLVNSPLE